jgi:peptidoglycan DL-endopeptidase CwlO
LDDFVAEPGTPDGPPESSPSTDRSTALRFARRIACVVVATATLALALSTTPPALADPLSYQLADKQAQAARVQAQITSLNTKVEIAAERYNAAGDKLAKINDHIAANAAKLRRLTRRQSVLDNHLGTRARDMYRSGRLAMLDVIFGSTSFEEFTANWDLMTQMSQNDASLISSVKSLKAQTQAIRRQLRKNQAAAAVQLRVRRRQKALVVNRLAQRKALLASVTAEIQSIMAAQAAAPAASAAASNGVFTADANFPKPTIPPHPKVLDYARTRLGCSYVWAAAGPDTFDCSGLAMWAYDRLGISIPHYSGAQVGMGQRVSRKDLQPGDLVFFGSPIHHVGIYAGGGQMIDAPYTGASVRYDNAFRDDYVGACRP